jgi:hypothetical protein
LKHLTDIIKYAVLKGRKKKEKKKRKKEREAKRRPAVNHLDT